MIEHVNVHEAHVRRAVERGGVRCGEVEVSTDRFGEGGLLIYFGPSLDNDYDMVAVVRNDADTEIDWYDNSMHDAFENIGDELFETETMKTDWGQREALKEQVLSYPGVRDTLARLL